VSLAGESLTNETLSIPPISSQLEFALPKKNYLNEEKIAGLTVHSQRTRQEFDAKRKLLHWKLGQGKKFAKGKPCRKPS
jgi:hypothetical protein